MGRVLTEATIESLEDLWAVERGLRTADQARRVIVSDALVNTETTLLSLPTSLICQLGLTRRTATSRVTSSTDGAQAAMYEAVRLTFQGRSCTMDVLEVPDGVPVLIGNSPLTHLDLVIDWENCRLTGNPAHGGEHMYEMY